MNVCLGWRAAVSTLDRTGVFPCNLPESSGRLLLTERSAEKQTKHKDFSVTDGELLGCFFVASGKVCSHLYVTLKSLLDADYSEARKKLLGETIRTEEVETTPRRIFIGHSYVQHAGREWRDKNCIQNYNQLNSKNYDLPDPIEVFALGDSTASGSRKHHLSLKKVLDQEQEE